MQTDNQDEINIQEIILKIRDWLIYLKSKWLIIVLLGILGGGIGFLYASLQKSTYIATMVFALEDEKSSSGGGLSGLASQFGLDMGSSTGGAFSGANLIELMKSRSIVEKSLLNPVMINGKEVSLAEYYINFNKWRESWQNKPLLTGIQFYPNGDRSKYNLQQDSILGVIYETLTKGNLNIYQNDKKVSFISIEVKSFDELFSKYLVENLAKEVSDFYVETKSKKAKLNLAILERQTDSIRNELNSSISGVASAIDNTYNLNPALNIKRVQSTRRQVDVQANTAILTELVKNLEMAKVTLRKETPLIQIIDKPILPLKKEKVSRLKSAQMGGLIGGFSIVFYLIFSTWWKKNIAI